MTEAASAKVAGVVLAGGLSRRMGGGDKGLLDLVGKPMLQHVIERLAPQVTALAINANGDPARFARFGIDVVPDTVEGFVGPLAGVLAGMRWAKSKLPDVTHIVTVAGDAPLVPVDLVARLGDAVRERPASIALAQSQGEMHPVIGIWPVALADDLEASLAEGVRKVLRWTDKHGTIPVVFEMVQAAGVVLDPFYNANTPEELEALRAALAGHGRAVVIGIAGWKNSGKTTLAERLIAELTSRGLKVASVKHAHHAFQVDDGPTDSARHRRAGAQQVAVVSRARWAIVRELQDIPEPPLQEILAKLDPADVVVVEGYKRAPIAKIEVRGEAAFVQEALAENDANVIAIASDVGVQGARVPVFGRGDIQAIADFVLSRTKAG